MSRTESEPEPPSLPDFAILSAVDVVREMNLYSRDMLIRAVSAGFLSFLPFTSCYDRAWASQLSDWPALWTMGQIREWETWRKRFGLPDLPQRTAASVPQECDDDWPPEILACLETRFRWHAYPEEKPPENVPLVVRFNWRGSESVSLSDSPRRMVGAAESVLCVAKSAALAA